MNDNFEAVTDCLSSSLTKKALSEIDSDIKDSIRGMIAGNIIGDMLGVTNEAVKSPAPIKDITGGGFLNLEAGEWTDDTSMLIALGESLHEKGHIDKENELKHYRMWLNEGKYTPKGKAVGTGKTTEFAIKNGYPKSDRMSNGNGALMRSSIITPYYLNLSDMRLAEASGDSAKVTHGHAVSVFTNIIFSLVLKKVILGQTVNAAMSNVSQKYRGLIEDVDIIFDKPERYITTPYCVTSLQTSLNIVSDSDSFEEAILKAVNLGGDADTIGAITGAIAGARFGIKDIPERFLKFALSEKILRYEGIKKFF